MNGKTFLAGIAAAVTSFLAGWLIYGLILAEFMKTAMIQHPGVMKDPPEIWAIFIANLFQGILMAWILKAFNSSTFVDGLVKGAIFGVLMGFMFDFYVYASMNIYNSFMGIIVDVIVTTIIAALMGGVIGLIFGTGKNNEA